MVNDFLTNSEPHKAAADSDDACANLRPCPCQKTTTVPADGWRDGENDGDGRKDGWMERRGEEGVMDGVAAESVRRSDGWKGTEIRRRCQV